MYILDLIMKHIDIHLVSDSNCESLLAIYKDIHLRFRDEINFTKYVWSFYNSENRIKRLFTFLQKRKKDAFIFYNISTVNLRAIVKNKARALSIPCIPLLSRIIREMVSHTGIKPKNTESCDDFFTEEYFSRVDAMNYVLAHDDGNNMLDFKEADIILIGVSRTSKSPTSVYLAYQGYKVANVPFISGISSEYDISKRDTQVILGLFIQPERLLKIRKSRVLSMDSIMHNKYNSKYTEKSLVIQELIESRKFFETKNFPIIDVTMKSIEEIASTAIALYEKHVKYV
ncbi:MAG: putative phosphotransferase [Candidatus Xenolissoclinum pacificiensis L6]|uniref:Phosphotransferase n=1 Tax=Candidatus Xenolissoclinum pacificiensis L6 TaxID=1401685 RepID=W2V2Q0_9RICK|nr:MAG: putative phosphotransferase [Candidatus Xenolissoclinum pacificiensis L6]